MNHETLEYKGVPLNQYEQSLPSAYILGAVLPRIKEAIDLFVEQRIEPGHFVSAVLSNDLRESIGRGDKNSIECISNVVMYCYNCIPSVCWGSQEKFRAWLRGPSEKKEKP